MNLLELPSGDSSAHSGADGQAGPDHAIGLCPWCLQADEGHCALESMGHLTCEASSRG